MKISIQYYEDDNVAVDQPMYKGTFLSFGEAEMFISKLERITDGMEAKKIMDAQKEKDINF